MKERGILAFLILCSLIFVRVACDRQMLLHEWTVLTIAAPVIYAGVRFGWTSSGIVMFLMMIADSPIAVLKYASNKQNGIDFELSTIAVGMASAFLASVIKRESESGASLEQIHGILDDIRKNADINRLLLSLTRLFEDKTNARAVELFLFDESGALKNFASGDAAPLRRDHLYYRVAEDGDFLVSDSIENDSRLIVDEAPEKAAEEFSQLIVFPIRADGAPVGVIAAVMDKPVRIRKDIVSFLLSAKNTVEFAMEAVNKRMETIGHEVRKEEIKNTFSSYVSSAVAEEILSHPDSHSAGGKLADVTVMFAELSNFQELLKKYPAEDLISMLNEYFSCSVQAVLAMEGTVDKFIGGKTMAYWGAPLHVPDDEEKAIAAARRILRETEALNNKWRAQGKTAFKVRIGINSGEVIAGNIGGIRRMEYTVIGDTVNTAARIASLASEMDAQLLVSESTAKRLRTPVKSDSFAAALKGKNREISIYRF